MQKKIIVGGVVVVVVLAAFLTVFNKMRTNFGGVSYDSGMMAPDAAGLPSRSLGMPSFKGGADTGEIFSEEAQVSDTESVSVDKKVIKNGNLDLKVSSVDKAAEDIAKIAKDNGGEIFSSNVYNFNNIKNGTVQVKVPVANFEKAFAEMKKVAALVIQESTSGQDVTEQYVDLQAQLKNKQAEEQQFVQILGQAQRIQDILDVTTELSRVRGEIEMLQGQLKFLDSQVDMASIMVSLSEDQNITITDSWRPFQVVKDAVNDLIKKAQGFINFLIVLVITVIPVAILYLLLAYIIYLIGKRIYSKIKSRQEQGK